MYICVCFICLREYAYVCIFYSVNVRVERLCCSVVHFFETPYILMLSLSPVLCCQYNQYLPLLIVIANMSAMLGLDTSVLLLDFVFAFTDVNGVS